MSLIALYYNNSMYYIYLYSQANRAKRMDDFFNSVNALMSNLLRRTVAKSLKDLVDMMEMYREGNNYPEEYHIFRGLAVAQLKQPCTIFLV